MIVPARYPLLKKFFAPTAKSAGACSASGISNILRSRITLLCMYSRVSGNGKIRRQASARAGARSATAAALTMSCSTSALLTAASENSVTPLRTMVSKTGWLSLSELLMLLGRPRERTVRALLIAQRQLLPRPLAKLRGLGGGFLLSPIPAAHGGAVLSGNRVCCRAILDKLFTAACA